MANCLVTGGAGFVGSHLVERLVKLGHSVRVVDNFSTGRRENLAPLLDRIELIEDDLLDPQVCHRATRDIDWVFHQAAIPSVARSLSAPLETIQNNAMITSNLLCAALQERTRRFIYAGSSSAYGDQDSPIKIETMQPQPLSPYAASKVFGEQLCLAFNRSYGLPTISLRYFNIFGPRQDPHSPYSAVIPLFIKTILESGQPVIYGDGQQSRDFTYIENAVEANILAATAPQEPRGETVNIACGKSYSVLDALQKICRIMKSEADPRFEPARAGDVRHSQASIEKAKAVIGYQPIIDFEEGLRRTIESMK